METKIDVQKCRITEWQILQGGKILVPTKPSLTLPGQNMEGILKVELARLSKMYKNDGFPKNLTPKIVGKKEIKSFPGLVADRFCPDHPHITARRNNFKPEDYDFCGKCGKKTQWTIFIRE